MKTLPYDPAEFLDDETAMADYLRLTCEDGSPAEIARALGAIAPARGMTEIAAKSGITRPALYKALSGEGNPKTRNRRQTGRSPRLPPYVRTPGNAARWRRLKALSGR